ncbi:MAG: vitamin B12 dependent methionine synthase, activation domain protein [Oscillospiraceae bacterium]|nr:vitamin B12 dependent methionine synthase, activation domain protein [Oscillospiraceae bacterium]
MDNHTKGGGAVEARLDTIPRGETLRYLAWHGAPLTEELEEDLDRCEALILEHAQPRLVWRLFELTEGGRFAGTDYTPGGQDIQAFLTGCAQAVLFAATLGLEAECLIRRTQLRNMADAVLLDAAGSAAIEAVCDAFCADLAAELAPWHLTGRFSPGYGDYPLEEQKAVFRLLDVTRRIGVNLTESGLMIPQKSVTALIGVSDTPQENRRSGCGDCLGRFACVYRKEGKSCGKT